MARAGATVAAFAVPVGVLAWTVARRRGEALLPRAKLWRVPWGGFELTFAFLFVGVMVMALLLQFGVPALAVRVVALPIQLMMLYSAWRLFYPAWRLPRTETSYAGLIAVAVAVWLVLTPLVLILNAAVTQLFIADEHPLTKVRVETLGDHVLFLLQACVAAPLVEEILFRGV